MALTRKQKRLRAEVEEIAAFVGVHYQSIEEIQSDFRSISLGIMKDKLVRSEVIHSYTLLDELLTNIIARGSESPLRLTTFRLFARHERQPAHADEDEAEQQGDAEQAGFVADDAVGDVGAGDAGSDDSGNNNSSNSKRDAGDQLGDREPAPLAAQVAAGGRNKAGVFDGGAHGERITSNGIGCSDYPKVNPELGNLRFRFGQSR